jgi:hypothetical protein
VSAASLNHLVDSDWPASAKSADDRPSSRSASRPLVVPSDAVTIPNTSASRARAAAIRASPTVPDVMSSPLWRWTVVANA